MRQGALYEKVIMTAAAALITCVVLHGFVFQSAHSIHEPGGDGIKNYFSYLYHSTYGRGWWFTGMNYPYGEHIMFVDGQPALTIPLAFIQKILPLSPEILNSILNLTIASSFFLAIVYVYKILKRFGLAPLWAIVFAGFIVTCSTQNFRMFGLYGLCYPCVVPMLFYWFIKYHDTHSIKYIVYTALLSVMVVFIHPYQFALVLVWTALYIAAYLLLKKDRWLQKLRHVLAPAVMLVIVIVLLKATMAFTDPHTDRPVHPHGLLAYCTQWKEVITSYYSPYSIYLQQKNLLRNIPQETQGYAYIGWAAAIIIAVCAFAACVALVSRRYNRDRFLPAGFSPVWLFIAVLALMYSMGIPFIWGLQGLYDRMSLFRQFRSLGWFALLFYYVATIFAAVVLYHFYQRNHKSRGYAALICVILVAATWACESYGFTRRMHVRQLAFWLNYDDFFSKKQRGWKEILAAHNYSAADFQAIIHVPYYHIGSEKIWLTKSNWGLSRCFNASYQLRLPLVDANMSRGSWQQTFAQVKIAGGPFARKPILYTVADNRPYLLLHFAEDRLTPDERYLLDQADSLDVSSGLVAYVLRPEKLRAADSIAMARAKHIGSTMASIDTSLSGKPYHYRHYDNGGNNDVFFGAGAARAVMNKDTVFDLIDIRTWQKDEPYEFSIWSLVDNKDYKSSSIIVQLLDEQGTELAEERLDANKATDTHGMWLRATVFFHIPPGCTDIRLKFDEHFLNACHGLDELLLRQASDTIITKDAGGRVLANNHLVR